jgi:putative PIN family toxin of toxin-antitoxin system
MRVVLDTSVLVAGLRSQPGASSRVLYAVAERRCIPLVTTAVFLEYEAVLLRSEQRLATGMSPEDVEGFLAAFASAAEPVELNFLWRPQLRDPADELMLEAAVNGRAEALVTHNVGDFQSATARFGVRTLTPGAILKEIER